MRARVLRALVEADPRDRAVRQGLELDAELYRTVLADCDVSWCIAGGEQRLRRRRVVDGDRNAGRRSAARAVGDRVYEAGHSSGRRRKGDGLSGCVVTGGAVDRITYAR